MPGEVDSNVLDVRGIFAVLGGVVSGEASRKRIEISDRKSVSTMSGESASQCGDTGAK